jgi:hypothetical protein
VSRSTYHGKRKARVYRIWMGMRYRCRNDKSGNYGGRGIRVCERWVDFGCFLEDMGEPPSAFHSIDRIDVNGHYEPGNCRWATRKEQARNQRTNTVLTFRGQNKTLAEWAEEFQIKPPTLCVRIYKLGWPLEMALTMPVESQSPTREQEEAIIRDWLSGDVSLRHVGRTHGFSHHAVKRVLERNHVV